MRTTLKSAGLLLACLALALFLLFPLYYAIVTSFKAGSELFRVSYWPHTIDLSNYARLWTEQNFARNIATLCPACRSCAPCSSCEACP